MSTSMTAFGDVHFRILAMGNGPSIVPDFERPAYSATVHVPGGNVNETFHLGRGAPVVTWQIECEDFDTYNDLDALVQTSATLRIPHGISAAPHTEVVLFGDVYDEIANVDLMALSQAVTRRDGTLRASATFQGDW